MTRKDLKSELERAIESSYMHQNKGTCTYVLFVDRASMRMTFWLGCRSVKIGLLSHSPKQVRVNLEIALPVIVGCIKGGWDNIQSLHIKTNTSISLPIWSCELGSEEGGRWDGLIAEEAEEKVISKDSEAEAEDEDEVEEEEEEPVTKGTKRRLAVKTEQPKKRPKVRMSK